MRNSSVFRLAGLSALLTLLSLALLTVCGGAVFAAEPPAKLNLYIWSEYIDPEIISSFEKKFNCKVTVDLYEDNESMMAKLAGGGSSLYDIIVPSDYVVPVLVKRDLIQTLNKSHIPNLKNVDPQFASPPFDPGNAYTAPYQWGTVGLYVRRKPGQQIDESWSLVYDAKKQPGPFVMIDSMRESMSSALKLMGHSVNDTDPEHLKKARDMLIEAKGRSVGFDGGVGGKNKVLSKVANMAIVYNGDAVRGMSEDEETYYFVPKEGGEIWLDSMAIPSKAPHKDLAEKFINYILEPDVGAQLSDFNQYATPNKAAKEKVNPDDLKNPAIYPSAEIMAKLEFLHDLGDKTKLFDEIWTQVKS
ncbi:MAG: spermidine/putrescine ABC transporter substrate-binding protein [Oligoflexia bacterium]|nr:spermidine/putrescine ABC transporter substrate-binding protein [Oligoflexia bacterium]